MTLKQLHTKLDIKKLSDSGEFEGYGSVFHEVDMGGDKVMPGAFNTSLATKPMSAIKLLWQHDPAQPIGMWEELREDERGLYVKGKMLTAIQRGAEVLAMMKAGVVDGLSIGFRTVRSAWEEGNDVRQLLEVDLWEISVVTFPMNLGARVDGVKMTIRDAESVLRDGGMPGNFAKLVAKYGFEEAERITAKERRDDGLVGVNANSLIGGFNFR
jgi:uncharacterized protein